MGKQKKETATFAAGCFWGVQAAFDRLKGVLRTEVGYTGGHLQKPSYDDVCTDNTGHAEAVLVEYDPSIISYEKLLDAFWSVHDPTQLNRQGPDRGTQYRSAIFYHGKEQQEAALRSKESLEKSKRFSDPIATLIVPKELFWSAEEYHQHYLKKRGSMMCH
jgi:peptide-methionine (S)-S-oxide reductase